MHSQSLPKFAKYILDLFSMIQLLSMLHSSSWSSFTNSSTEKFTDICVHCATPVLPWSNPKANYPQCTDCMLWQTIYWKRGRVTATTLASYMNFSKYCGYQHSFCSHLFIYIVWVFYDSLVGYVGMYIASTSRNCLIDYGNEPSSPHGFFFKIGGRETKILIWSGLTYVCTILCPRLSP